MIGFGMPPLDILFEDEHLLVLNKAPGISTQAPGGIDSLEVRVREYLQGKLLEPSPFGRGQGEGAASELQNSQHPHANPFPKGEGAKAKRLYLGFPHRLDRPVSGVIVFAKTIKAARKLSKQFERRKVKKIYWAAVEGIVEPSAGTWTDTLCKIPGAARAQVVAADHPEGQLAILHYRTIGQTPHGSLLEIELETGRMHQIRVQAASRGWRVLGDAQYGSTIPFGEQFEDTRLRAIALHARSLSIMPPGSAEVVTFTAPLGEFWPEVSSQ
jgi:23S rRNA pseudouridine1911/1915/1917 synthase